MELPYRTFGVMEGDGDHSMEEPQPNQALEANESEDDDIEETTSKDVRVIREQMKISGDSYDLHLKLVTSLRALGDWDALTQARQPMRDKFPLGENVWIEWIEDEISVNRETGRIVKLYELAVVDFLSPKIWMNYLNYVESRLELFGDAEFMDSFWERCLMSVGYHYTSALSFWKKFFSYLRAGDVSNEKGRRYCSEALKIPMLDFLSLENMYAEFEKEHGRLVSVQDQERIDRTRQLCHLVGVFEEKIQEVSPSEITGTGDESLMIAWNEYITFLEKNYEMLGVQFVRCGFERAIRLLFLHHELWTRYFLYIHDPDRFGQSLEVVNRGLRNCPWSGELWSLLLRYYEEQGDNKMIQQSFEKSQEFSFQNVDGHLEVVMSMCSVYRRRLKLDSLHDVPSNQTALRELSKFFKKGFSYLEYTDEFTEKCFDFCQFYADYLVRICKDLEAARKVWRMALSKNSLNHNAWLGSINFEKMYGSFSACHDLFVRFFETFDHSSNNSWIFQVMSKEWISFETKYGASVQHFNQALRTVGFVNADQSSLLEKRKGRKRDIKSSDQAPVSKDAKRAKTGQLEAQDEDHSKTVFVVNLPLTATQSDLELFFGKSGNVVDVRIGKRNPGIAYIEYDSVGSMSLACEKLDGSNFRGNIIQVRPSKPPRKQVKVVDGVEINPLSVFVGNLSLGESDESIVLHDLKELFKEVIYL
eukprot:TRINITY_DN4796_c0_g1_i8.p1 TRINITY_DN4796_c0_g1~~TRINITY_DN4796_c0_g1_i8.p1  ORF type:complete len:702 (+),score=168.81 TRINITY_DN4796_c0_g1_i8:2389-4494(+)